MKKFVLFGLSFIVCLLSVTPVRAQETTIGADVVSSYIWRGQDLGSASLQPTLAVGYKGLSLTAWGSCGLVDADDDKEIDLTLNYTIGGLNIGITDYWTNDGGDPEGRYFKYNAHGTNHVFEANIGYDFGFASLSWFTNFAGNDYNEDGKRDYSSYMEVAVPFKFSAIEWTATAGAVPSASVQYGTNGFAVTNLSLKATKDIKVTDSFSIPVFAQVTANPCSQMAYLVLGFTLQP
jgi:hypothetical protein